jgi:alkaline phosphatase
LPATALVATASLDSIVTDSAPGASCYATGNKANNNQEGVFPDDTKDKFDNPRVEAIGEYFARTQGKWLGIVTTADVTDATPGAFGVHTQDRSAGTGIADQLIDETAAKSNLRVLLGGGRRWFLPDSTSGSGRFAEEDYELPDELASGWGVARGAIDAGRDLLNEARAGGFTFAGTATQLKAVPAGTRQLLGLFHLGGMNAVLDRIQKRRGQSTVVDDFGFPDQPMLDEMTDAALNVLRQNASGFVLMIEGGLIDKQSHQMDTERWLYEVIEFDRAVARAKAFVQSVPDTLLIVTADHETGGANIIGASVVSQADLANRAAAGGGAVSLRDGVVGTGTAAHFPNYTILPDGFPATPDVNRRMLVGYAANADRYEDWQTNAKPIEGPAGYPSSPTERDVAGRFLVVGQVPGKTSAHTGSDVPLSAQGAGATLFTGVMDNTEVFFKMMQAALGGAPAATANVNLAPTTGISGGPAGVSTLMTASTSQRTAKERLVNLSSRGLVGAGEGAMINGFVLTGTQPHQLLIRGVGPTLGSYGVNSALADPFLRVRDASGATVALNDDWETNSNAVALREASSALGAFALTSGGKDAALLLTLSPGNYTVELSGMGAATGVGLLEIYELP